MHKSRSSIGSTFAEPGQAAQRVSQPRLRCWQDRRGDLHIATNLGGGRVILDKVVSLKDVGEPLRTTLRLDDSPFPESKNPAWQRGLVRRFRQLDIVYVPDPSQVQYIFAHALDDDTAEIRLGSAFLPHFLKACDELARGGGDFSVGLETVDIWPSRRRRLRTLDRDTRHVWFWGELNPHHVNTF